MIPASIGLARTHLHCWAPAKTKCAGVLQWLPESSEVGSGISAVFCSTCCSRKVACRGERKRRLRPQASSTAANSFLILIIVHFTGTETWSQMGLTGSAKRSILFQHYGVRGCPAFAGERLGAARHLGMLVVSWRRISGLTFGQIDYLTMILFIPKCRWGGSESARYINLKIPNLHSPRRRVRSPCKAVAPAPLSSVLLHHTPTPHATLPLTSPDTETPIGHDLPHRTVRCKAPGRRRLERPDCR